jgi:hypothetical protein
MDDKELAVTLVFDKSYVEEFAEKINQYYTKISNRSTFIMQDGETKEEHADRLIRQLQTDFAAIGSFSATVLAAIKDGIDSTDDKQEH